MSHRYGFNHRLINRQHDRRLTTQGLAMNILKHLRFRTKLAIVMALAALALVSSIAMAASVMRSRMLEDRVAELRSVVDSAVGLAQSLEDQVTAHQLSHEQALEQLRHAAHVIRFDRGQGYIFAQTLDNVFIVHGANPKLGEHSVHGGRRKRQIAHESNQGGTAEHG